MSRRSPRHRPARQSAEPSGSAATGPAGRVAALDGLRGIAVLLVVLTHAGNSLWPAADRWLARGGPLGVHLFFVLSGFLITTILLREGQQHHRVDLVDFARRRAVRLLPALLVLLGVCLAVAASRPGPGFREMAKATVPTLTFTTNLVMKGGDNPIGAYLRPRVDLPTELAQLWSLAIEVHFYVLWSIVLWGATRLQLGYRQLAVLLVVFIVAVAAWRVNRFEQGTNWLTIYLSTSTRLDAPLVGALAGVVVTAGWLPRVPDALLALLGALGLAGFVVAAFTVEWFDPILVRWLYLVLALAAAVAIVGTLGAPTAYQRLLCWRPLTGLGLISYSLYLWHYVIFWTFERKDPDWPQPARFVVGMAVALAAAWLSYRLIEHPVAQRFGRSRRLAAPPTPLSERAPVP